MNERVEAQTAKLARLVVEVKDGRHRGRDITPDVNHMLDGLTAKELYAVHVALVGCPWPDRRKAEQHAAILRYLDAIHASESRAADILGYP